MLNCTACMLSINLPGAHLSACHPTSCCAAPAINQEHSHTFCFCICAWEIMCLIRFLFAQNGATPAVVASKAGHGDVAAQIARSAEGRGPREEAPAYYSYDQLQV